jgi:hypothetical protein
MRVKRTNYAISQILGTTLLLFIALAALSLVYLFVLTYPTPIPPPQVEIIGRLEQGNIVLLHSGGDSLKLDTKLRLNISDTTYLTTVGEYLDGKSKQNGKWDISEQVIYTPTINITNLHVDATIIDRDTDTVLMMIIIQE